MNNTKTKLILSKHTNNIRNGLFFILTFIFKIKIIEIDNYLSTNMYEVHRLFQLICKWCAHLFDRLKSNIFFFNY